MFDRKAAVKPDAARLPKRPYAAPEPKLERIQDTRTRKLKITATTVRAEVARRPRCVPDAEPKIEPLHVTPTACTKFSEKLMYPLMSANLTVNAGSHRGTQEISRKKTVRPVKSTTCTR